MHLRLALIPRTRRNNPPPRQGDLTLLIKDMVAASSGAERKLSEATLEASMDAYYLLYAVRPTSHRPAVTRRRRLAPASARRPSRQSLSVSSVPTPPRRARSSS